MPQRVQEVVTILQAVKLEILTFLIVLFSPIVPALLFIGLLIFADTLTGMWKAFKRGGWSNVKSRPLSDGLLPKLTMYPLILLIASGCEHMFSIVPFIKGSVFLLMCIELKSLIENINVILKINLFTHIKSLYSKGYKGYVKEVLDDKVEDK